MREAGIKRMLVAKAECGGFVASGMRRVHFIELHEQAWLPQSIRNEITDILQFAFNLTNVYGPVVPLLQRALHSAGSHDIVDLCSGGGGPWPGLSRKLEANARPIQIRLTDKYPNVKPFENMESLNCAFTFHPEPVDATNVPAHLKGFRTMFTSFHHFSREEALAVLRNSVQAGQGIAIFEITSRAPSTIALMFVWALAPFIFVPFARPFRWSRLFWTYVIPIIPFVLLFDAIVSCLRTYRPHELRELTAEIADGGYLWEVGKFSSGAMSLPITYLIGVPPGATALSQNTDVPQRDQHSLRTI